MTNLIRYCTALFLLACAALAAAEESTARTYQLPNHGALQLLVPNSWHDEIRQPPSGAPPTITFKPASGPAFQIMVTPMYPSRPGTPMPDLGKLRANLARAVAEAAPRAVESKISLNEIRGPSAAGYYYSATDKTPAPGEFKIMAQAELLAGDVAPVMTMLTDDSSGAVLNQALAMIKSAKHLKQ